MNLDDYINEVEIKEDMLSNALVLARDAPNIKDVYVVCESIKELKDVKGFDGFKKEVFKKVKALSNNIDKNSLVFANKIIMSFDKKNNSDKDNLNIKGKVIIGQRKLEDLENKIMEEFYV